MNTNSKRSPISFTETIELDRLDELFNRWNKKEIEYVRKAVNGSHRPIIRNISILVSTLSNGWLYVGVAILMLASQGIASWSLLFTGGLAACISHCFYPIIKKHLARTRPCDYDATIDLSVKVLDEYSCPSGHVMTATAVAIPLAIAMPTLLPLIMLCCLIIAWSRISLGHHYPSDLLFGALLGSVVSLPISLAII